MYSKKHNYEKRRERGLFLLKGGFVKTFEESFLLGVSPLCLMEAEKAERAGDLNKYYKERMKAASSVQERDEWLAKYFYKSCSNLQEAHSQLGLLEERLGHMKGSIRHLRRALASEDSEKVRSDLRRMYCSLGLLTKELKYYRRAASLIQSSDNSHSRAVVCGQLGKALLKLNQNEEALENFEKFITLSKESKDTLGVCNGYFAMSEIYKKKQDLEQMLRALERCRHLSEENGHKLPLVFSFLSLGQLDSVKRNYYEAHQHFESAHGVDSGSVKVSELCSVLSGIGRAHVTFGHFAEALQSSEIRKVLDWRNTGGPFSH